MPKPNALNIDEHHQNRTLSKPNAVKTERFLKTPPGKGDARGRRQGVVPVLAAGQRRKRFHWVRRVLARHNQRRSHRGAWAVTTTILLRTRDEDTPPPHSYCVLLRIYVYVKRDWNVHDFTAQPIFFYRWRSSILLFVCLRKPQLWVWHQVLLF